MLCPCGSSNKYKQCCEPLIIKSKLAQSPEQLMRSRYSAYAINQVNYIYNTYSSESKKGQSLIDISSWAKETTWIKLSIVNSSPFKKIQYPTVEFEAIYKSQDKYFKMKEKSRFIMENNSWAYVDGTNLEHNELISPNRNDKCFCLSEKKFKKCCGAIQKIW